MNFVQFAFVVTVSLLCHVNCENTNLAKFDERAIVNGYNAPYRPFYVQLRFRTTGKETYGLCGGTIIGMQYVLTGGHCFFENGKKTQYDWIDVLVGDMSQPDYESSVTILSVKNHTVHPGYLGYTEQGYDLAILKLNQTVSSARILKMCKSEDNYAQGYTLAVCGFGLTIPHGGADSDPPQLREAQVQETGTDRSCGTDKMFNKELQVCLGSIPGRPYSGPCQGDSGGPVFPLSGDTDGHNPICLYATTSFGATPYDTCDADTVFNRVSYFKDWIENQVWNVLE